MKEAIKMMSEDESGHLSRCVTTIVYPTIAKKLDDRAICVEMSIRHALENAWFNSTHDYFRHMDKKPTNSEFIALVVEKLRLEKQSESV